MKKRTLFLALLLMVNVSHGQDSSTGTGFKKNMLFATGGTLLPFAAYIAGSVYYERMLTQKKVASFVRTGYGGFSSIAGDQKHLLFQYGILTGQHKHHFELAAGSYNPIPGNIQDISLSFSAGWRIQRPGEHEMFRLGVAFPEAIYIGFGFCF
jgi:hypothetical protein